MTHHIAGLHLHRGLHGTGANGANETTPAAGDSDLTVLKRQQWSSQSLAAFEPGRPQQGKLDIIALACAKLL